MLSRLSSSFSTDARLLSIASWTICVIADEEPYYGEIPDLPGVWATGKSLKECEANLQAALEDWLLFLLARGETPPPLGEVRIELPHGEAA